MSKFLCNFRDLLYNLVPIHNNTLSYTEKSAMGIDLMFSVLTIINIFLKDKKNHSL